MKIKLLELFGGIGAPRMALQNIGVDVKSIDYVEILPYAVKAYNSMFDNNYKPQNIKDWDLNVDILVHGSPCQDWSAAGLNNVNTGRSILFEKTLDIIEHDLSPRPKVVIWENVAGLLHGNNREYFDYYLREMDRLGYNSNFRILNSLDFGIPQSRPRVFTISIRKDIGGKFNFDRLEKKPLRPFIDFIDKDPLVENGDYDMKQPSMVKAYNNGKVNVILTYTNTLTTKPMRWNTCVVFKDYKNFYTIPRKTNGQLINENYNRIWKISNMCGTLTVANINKIGELKGQKLEYRYLTPREYFRLMGFKDDGYNKLVLNKISKTNLYSLAGNSIVVPVLEAIFKEVLKEVDFTHKSRDVKYKHFPKYKQGNLFNEYD